MSTDNYERKLDGCRIILERKVKKVKDETIKAAAKDVGLSTDVMKRAWFNLQESGGSIDKRRTNDGKTGKKNFGNPTVRAKYTKQKKGVSAEEAGKAIREYMTGSLNSREIANKYQFTLKQFYSFIKELNVHGTLLGKKVLDPKKYAKIEVKDAIWLRKFPNTTRKTIKNLSETERIVYKRVGDVLLMYLPK